MSATWVQFAVLGATLPLQLLLVPLNARTKWLTPGELRFWAVALFVIGELCYLTVF
jgi:hypothetical protein